MEQREQIRKFIDSNLLDFVEEVDFNDDDNIFTLGLVNSLFAMKLLKYIKTEYNIEIESDDMEMTNFSTVKNIMEFVARKSNLAHP